MNFELSDKARALQDNLLQFMDREIYPVEQQMMEHFKPEDAPWPSPRPSPSG